jgi:DNA repair protein RecN (Recombination protein N)
MELHLAEQKVQHVGSQLSLVREGAIENLQKGVEVFLSQLSMTDARIRFNLEKGQQPTRNGLDHIQLLVSMNKGSDFQSIDRSASGGELSRIMLALKTILSEGAGLQTIVFDEIDTGVSGEIANQVAELMGRISQKMQVITITHLPQLAAKGRQHYKVYKESKDEETKTKIVSLNSDERLVEIAEMLSGKNPSEAAVQNARELLN